MLSLWCSKKEFMTAPSCRAAAGIVAAISASQTDSALDIPCLRTPSPTLRRGGYQGRSLWLVSSLSPRARRGRFPSQRKHEQHGLITHLAQFRRQDQPALGNLAQSRQDGDILPATDLECHRRGIEAAPDVDFP